MGHTHPPLSSSVSSARPQTVPKRIQRLSRDGSDDKWGSFEGNSSLPRFQSRTFTPGRSVEQRTPIDGSVGSLPPLRRPASQSVPNVVPFVRKEGFKAQVSGFSTPFSQVWAQEAVEAERDYARPAMVGQLSQSLLSRELSRDNIAVGHHMDTAPSDLLKEQLQKCYEVSSDLPRPSTRPTPATDSTLEELQTKHPVFRVGMVARSYAVAKSAHEDQFLANGEPVIQHCVATARILAELGLDAETVAAGLLHDVLDKSMMTEEQLRKVVPDEVVDMVQNVSKMSEVCRSYRDSWELHAQALDRDTNNKLATMLLAMADVRGVLVKLAERLHILRQLDAMPQHKRARVADETLHVFAPLANRLGVWSVKAELEDLCFRALQPQAYANLEARLGEVQQRKGLEGTLNTLKAALDAQGCAYEDLSGRPKNLYGVHTKMAAKGYGLDQIHDVRAVRIIVRSKADCYATLRQVEKLWRPLEGKLKDYIRTPKVNGYQSLHTVVMGADGVPFEVQIRTHKMHYIAEYGVAAHWRYKEQLASSNLHVEQQVAWARWLIEWKLELEDNKCRPSGSPPKDSSSLLAAFGGGLCPFPEHTAGCKFRNLLHHAGQGSHFGNESNVGAADLPVYVIVDHKASGYQVAGSGAASSAAAPTPAPLVMQIEELPAGATAGQLVASGKLGAVPAHGAKLLINHQECHSKGTKLRSGDKVEVFLSGQPGERMFSEDEPLPYTQPVLYRSASWGDEELLISSLSSSKSRHFDPKSRPLEAAREQLSRMYEQSSGHTYERGSKLMGPDYAVALS